MQLNTGLYLLVGKLTGKRSLGFAAASLGNTVNVLRTIARSDEIGLKNKAGLAIWVVLGTAAAVFAIKNENSVV